ncbi:MAG: acetate--CoA ligase family protein [Prochloraceae cyanobacterium]|nr:acetate--CoA ligase family protein [Prochloraceae cyanobacterium]
MDLLEYQAKQLFSKVGIPLLPSQTIEDPRELKQLQIPYPVVLKSQVRAGGRGKAGGIHFVENTIDAIAAARSIFNLPIMGQYPQVLLAEARYNSQEEFFLAIVLDYQLQRPVLLGSAKGGIEIEPLLENLQKVVVKEEFSLFYARRLAIKMGLAGELIDSVSAIVEKMYRLFVEQDLDIVEINPLGVSSEGELMALDGKITVNESVLVRHPDLLLFQEPQNISQPQAKVSQSSILTPELRWLDWNEEEGGNIGIISNSLNLALVTWDLISQNKGKIDSCVLVGQETALDLQPNSHITRQIHLALQQLMELRELKIVVANFLGNPEFTQIVAQAIVDYLKPQQELKNQAEERSRRVTGSVSRSRQKRRSQQPSSKQKAIATQRPFSLVVRLVGAEIEPIKEHLAQMPVYFTDDLEEAVNKTISLTKSS